MKTKNETTPSRDLNIGTRLYTDSLNNSTPAGDQVIPITGLFAPLPPEKTKGIESFIKRAKEVKAPLFTLLDHIAASVKQHPMPAVMVPSLLLTVYRESNFNAIATNKDSQSFGFLQLMPSNVRRIAHNDELKNSVSGITEQLAAFVEHQSPETAKQLRSGNWPTSIVALNPFWQLPFCAVMLQETFTKINQLFKYDDRVGWLASDAVRNSRLLDDMYTHADVYRLYGPGWHALFTDAWAHGFPAAFLNDERNLVYYNDHLNLPLEEGRRFASLLSSHDYAEFIKNIAFNMGQTNV